MTAKHDGMSCHAVAEAMGVTPLTANNALRRLKEVEQAQMRWKGGRGPARWYASQYAPTGGTPGRALVVVTKGKKPQKLEATAEVIVPAHVRVQVCPCGMDTRFTPDPSVAGRGAITQDWRERRLAEKRA